jgi:hypothetical protein
MGAAPQRGAMAKPRVGRAFCGPLCAAYPGNRRNHSAYAVRVESGFNPFAFHKWRMIQRGLLPKQAVCAVMNRMARVIWAMVAKNSFYDVNDLIVQIRIHHGDLWKTFVQFNQNKPSLWKNVNLEHRKIA